MENNNNYKYKVSITSWNKDVWCYLTVQENVNGQFGKTEKIFLPAHKLEWLGWHDVLRLATEMVDRGEFGESDIQAPVDQKVKQENEKEEEPDDNYEAQEAYMEAINDEYPSRFEGIKEAIVSIFQKSRPFIGLVGVVLWLVFLISLQTQKEIKADKIAQFNSEITEIRKEREQVYSQCTAQCNASREVYDAQVILKKKQIKELELSSWSK